MTVSKIRRVGYGLAGICCLALLGCTGIPEGVEPVTGFDQERYLGTWYEIARLDHSFEPGGRGWRIHRGLPGVLPSN
jgi:lipocalin